MCSASPSNRAATSTCAASSAKAPPFTLYLPEVVALDEPCTERVQKVGLAPLGSGQSILIVEDNVGVGQFATQILEDLGYGTWASNAERALERLGGDGSGFDLVFSDVVMPGMGGVGRPGPRTGATLAALPVVLTRDTATCSPARATTGSNCCTSRIRPSNSDASSIRCSNYGPGWRPRRPDGIR